MPNTTKKSISDAVLYKLAGGVPTKSFPVHEEDVWSALEQKINAMFGMRQFNMNLPSGETIPDNLVLATYEDVAVTSFNSGNAKSVLPVIPISLPRNAGINEIRPVLSIVESGDRILGNPMIPLLAGQNYLLQADSLLNSLQGQFGYEPNGRNIIYTSDITTLGITKVDMKLVVFDMSQYGITDVLPIPSDYEDELETQLIQEFAPVLAKSGFVSNYTNPTQQPVKQ